MNKYLLKLFLSVSFVGTLQAEGFDITQILSDIEKKSDLSAKTKLENSGISFIYTRDDLERMQARYLKDILKSSYTQGYDESRFGLPDPLTRGATLPFASPMVRVFVDNQEITSGFTGSGIGFYGDIDLGFVDHIEVYSQNPTYEYATESTFMLVKLYSKVAQKDAGSKVEVNVGSYSSHRTSIYNANEINDEWSYFAYLSNNNDKRKEYHVEATELSRDKEVSHLFTSLYTNNQHILIDITKQDRDTFAGNSLDATPLSSTLKAKSLHVGYDATYKDFSVLASYDYYSGENYFLDDVVPLMFPPFNGSYPVASRSNKNISEVYNLEGKYKYSSEHQDIVTGVKYRHKHFDKKFMVLNGINKPRSPVDTQDQVTFFIEDSFKISANSIFSVGLNYTQLKTKASEQDDSLFMHKFSYTYIYNNFIFKLLNSYTETPLMTYLIDSSIVVKKKLEAEKMNNTYFNFIYEQENNRYEFLLGKVDLKDYLLPDRTQGNKLDNFNNGLYIVSGLLRWTHEYNDYDKFFFNVAYEEVHNVSNSPKIQNYTAVARSLNTIGKFDIFNELIYFKDDYYNRSYYDYSAGIKYQYNDDFILSFKGENIFDRAKTQNYFRIDPVTFQSLSPLEASPIDRKVTFSMEYLF